METNYHILHLVNGQTLVGDLEYTVESVMLKFPLEVSSKTITDDGGKVLGEHMVLRPFLIMTDDRELMIDQFNVLCCVTLSQRLYKSYEDMVEHVYGKQVSFDGDFYSGEKENKDIEDLNQEEAKRLQDQVNDIIDNLNDRNDNNTLH